MRSLIAALLVLMALACGAPAPAKPAGPGAIRPPDAPPTAVEPAPTAPAPSPSAPSPPAAGPSTSIDAETRAALIDQLATSVAVLYVFPETGALLESELRGRLSVGAYATLVDAEAFAEQLTTDLRTVSHDLHFRVVFDPNGPGGPHPGPAPGAPPSGISKIEVLDGNIGYIALDGVPPLDVARPGIEAAFAQLLHTNALIIDNRNNHGGDPHTVALYVSYLSEGPPVVINRFHPRNGEVIAFETTDVGARSYGVTRPVFVLTSGETFSGGEELSYDLQASRRAVLIGERTGGGANPVRAMPLGNSGLVAFVPDAQPINPITGKNWEGVGVTPDVAVPAERALDEALARARAAVAQPASGKPVSSARAPAAR